MDLGIAGKVALVTASSRGLGKEVASCLAGEGARLILCARGKEALEATATELRGRGAEVLARACDLSRAEDVGALVAEGKKRYGRIDILVANCGGPPPGKFLDHSPERWREAIELNLMSVVQLCREVAPQMAQQRWGRIVLMTSIAVKQPIDGLILSNSVRAAVVGLGKTLAGELGPAGVLVNMVCPGYFLTDRVRSLSEKHAAATGEPAEALLNKWAAASPLGRVGDPKEFAPLAAFLCSERSSFITGATFAIDGGLCRSLL